jgi:hypothetical protein
MPDDDIPNDHSTYNELTNEERQWLERNGYQPGELTPKQIRDEMEQDSDTDDDSGREATNADEVDGTDAK